MLRITIEVDIPSGMEFAVKEDLAMAIEQRYGRTTRVVSVEVGDDNDTPGTRGYKKAT